MTDADLVPICGFCGLPEHWHYAQDHDFNQVGGGRVVTYCRLTGYDLKCPQPEPAKLSWRQRAAAIITLAGLAWLIIGALWRWV